MRKIRFRGKSYTDNQWHYGFYSYQSANAFAEERHEIIEFSRLGYNCPAETIGQHTGLNDTDGVPIYEGDVLEDTAGWVFEVRWDSENGRFLGYHSKPRGDTYICYVGREPKSTVIGNIHDTPELLEDDK